MDTKEVKLISIENLELDPDNPRLPQSVERTQDKMLEYIARNTSIEELMGVIAQNDFFEGEALIAYPRARKQDRYIVIEGNRRLTAVRLLNDPGIYSKRHRIQEIVDTAKYIPKELPVIVVAKREDVLTYLGYRHITGVKQWDPLAKARYMYQLFSLTEQSLSAEERYRLVASEIGSRRDHIKRTLDALAVYKLVDSNDFFAIEELTEDSLSFSLLTTAVAYPSIQRYVGADEDPITNADNLDRDHVEKLTRWMFEARSNGETILGESRNIGKLANIVENDKAVAALIKGANLEYAYRLTAGIANEFTQYLYDAQTALQNANSIVANVRPDDDLTMLADNVAKAARNVSRSLRDFEPESDD